MAIYKKDKCVRVNARISEEQLFFIEKLKAVTGLTSSEVLRMIIDSYCRGVHCEDKQTNFDN